MSTLLTIAKIAKANKLAQLIITEPIRNNEVFNKKHFEKYIIDEVIKGKRRILTLTKSKKYKSHIIFLHGGAFTDEAIILHRIFIQKILDKYETKVTFIDYPLTPECNYKAIQSFTLDAIEDLKIRYNNDKFYFMGDSSGGGLAVTMLQILNKRNITINKTVLLSPWVDVSMNNPDIEKHLNKDFTLNFDNLIKCGISYADTLKTNDPKVSPLYGNLSNMGKLLIYVSDNELLYPDILKFHELVNKNKNSSSKLIIGKKLCHDYPLLIIIVTSGIIKEMLDFLIEE